MNDDDLAAHLRRLGLPAVQVAIYRRLLESGPADIAGISSVLGITEQEAADAVAGLTKSGLVSAVDDTPTVAPIDPGVGLQSLARAREAELRMAEIAATDAYRQFRRTVWQQPTDDIVEVISEPQLADRVAFTETNVREEVLHFLTPPYTTATGPNEIELANLRRGVTYRCVYSRTAVRNGSDYVDNIQPCIAAGEQARVLPDVPVKLAIYDRKIAFVGLSDAWPEITTGILVKQSTLLAALCGLFETSWRAALPMHLGTKEPSSLRPMERRIIELLASGITDNAIAELLGISRRTLSRNLESLTTRAGVVNRFQLAVYACRNGWI